MSSNTLKIVQGLAQAAANSYDGSHDERYAADGKARKAGLSREEGDPILDSRVIDGFKVKMSGNKLCIHYLSEVKLKDVHDSNFEADIEEMIGKVAAFIKKEYKKVTGDTLTLTADGEMEAMVQSTSRVRTFVQAHRWYSIGGIGDVEPVAEASEERLRDNFKKWLSLGKNDVAR